MIFKSGLEPSDISFYRPSGFSPADNSLVFEIKETGETVTFPHWFSLTTYRIGAIEFEDGGSLDLRDIHTGLADGQHSYEENGSLTLVGSNASDLLTGYGGGDDTIYGGDERDVIDGGYGNDLLLGEEGNDHIVGGGGNDTLIGGTGNDNLIGDQFRGEVGDDLLDGGAGNDFLNGREGNDIYLFGHGDGQDTISTVISRFLIDEGDVRTLIFKEGVSPEEIEFSKEGSDLKFHFINTDESILVSGWFNTSLTSTGQLQSVEFEGGGHIDIQLLGTLANEEVISVNNVFVSDSPLALQGTEGVDVLEGTISDELIYSGGVSFGVESIRGNGGADTLVIGADAANAEDSAGNSNAHFRIRDFVIDDVTENADADVFDIGAFLLGSGLNASNIGNYLHVVSGLFGDSRTGVFVDKEGQFTEQERINLTNSPTEGGNGADLFFEFQGQAANNNFSELTGFADNTEEQFQALIDLGFLDLSNANSESVERPIEEFSDPLIVQGTLGADNLEGSVFDDVFISEGLSSGVESILGNGGNDILMLQASDAVAVDSADNSNAHFRIRDFTIADHEINSEADTLDISDLLSGFSIDLENVEDHLHIVSGTFGESRSSIFIDRDGQFSDAEREALTANAAEGGQGADIFLEFQGQSSNNNLEVITGYSDNSSEQLQALIDFGFLDIV